MLRIRRILLRQETADRQFGLSCPPVPLLGEELLRLGVGGAELAVAVATHNGSNAVSKHGRLVKGHDGGGVDKPLLQI